jgi:cytochrome bd-type quinol oxidase subunit 2
MLNRKFFDILTILFGVIIISTMILGFNAGKMLIFGDVETAMTLLAIINLTRILTVLVYYIFTLVLVSQLYSKEKVKVTSIVLVAIFVPFAVFYYLFSYRKLLKEYESENNYMPNNSQGI